MTRPRHQCRQCKQLFPVTPRHLWYCSDDCVQKARTRACAWCRKDFPARGYGAGQKKYCSAECRELGHGLNMMAHAQANAERQRRESRVDVVCTYAKCPRRHDLISLRRSEAQHPSKCRHPECRVAAREDWKLRGAARKGDERDCKGCRRSMGYLPPNRLDQEYCTDCTRQGLGRASPRRGEWRVCDLEGCTTPVYVRPSQVRRSATGLFYCCPAHGYARPKKSRAQPRTVRARCRVCDHERRVSRGKEPRTFDETTATYLCERCRPWKTETRDFVCSRSGCSVSFPRRVRIAGPTIPRFCTEVCRSQHRRALQRLCARCNGPILRRGQSNVYCSLSCYHEAEKDHPNPHRQPSKAELLIEPYIESGERRIRVIVDRTGVARNTVRRVFRERGIVAGPHALT